MLLLPLQPGPKKTTAHQNRLKAGCKARSTQTELLLTRTRTTHVTILAEESERVRIYIYIYTFTVNRCTTKYSGRVQWDFDCFEEVFTPSKAGLSLNNFRHVEQRDHILATGSIPIYRFHLVRRCQKFSVSAHTCLIVASAVVFCVAGFAKLLGKWYSHLD